MYYKTYYDSPVGKLLLVSDETSLIGLWIEGQKYYLGNLNIKPIQNDNIRVLVVTKKWLDRYFKAEKPSISELKLAPIGSEFRQKVFKILCEIPYGKTTTYKDIAVRINKNSAQAVGNAVAHNPISIIIPCHRVIGTNGSLTGYAGGIDNKIKLLELENVDVNKFTKPKKEKNYD